MWEDARVMFMMCASDYGKAFSYFNLGVADFNLGLMDEAEKMLAHVNYMDPNHAETWAYLTLVLLKKTPAKVNAAYQCMNEAFKLGLKNPMLSQHIFYEWVQIESAKGASEALEHLCCCQGGPRWMAKIIEHISQMKKVADDHNATSHFDNLDSELEEMNKNFYNRCGQLPETVKNSLKAMRELICGNMNVRSGHLDPLK